MKISEAIDTFNQVYPVEFATTKKLTTKSKKGKRIGNIIGVKSFDGDVRYNETYLFFSSPKDAAKAQNSIKGTIEFKLELRDYNVFMYGLKYNSDTKVNEILL